MYLKMYHTQSQTSTREFLARNAILISHVLHREDDYSTDNLRLYASLNHFSASSF